MNRLLLPLLLLVVAACGSSRSREGAASENATRARLGIPAAAERVLIVSQSSHLDLNFLLTFDGYWQSSVRDVIHTALGVLDSEPQYRYSIAEVAWLRRYWDEHPEDRERIRSQAASGALRVVGGGLTSPDSLLPTGESLVRDFLLGMSWTRANLGVLPTAAWVPDSFGHAPTLPSLLEHFDLGAVGMARIDGVKVLAKTDTAEPGQIITMPGSDAAALADAGSADWVWRAPDGAEAIAHWMPFGYGDGDDLDFTFPWYSLAGLGVDWNDSVLIDPSVTNDHFAMHIDRLAPLSRTPYGFLPVGIDFSWPKRKLLDYVARWNQDRYPTTGVWIAAATFDDYVQLLAAHRRELPVIESDLSPYFSGFYTTHPTFKSTIRKAHEALVAAEIAGVAAATVGADYPYDRLDQGWDNSAFMNHHDAITGTTTQEALAQDLGPWSNGALDAGEQSLAAMLGALSDAVDTSATAASAALVVLNPSGHDRADLVELDVTPSPAATAISVTDATGAVLPSQLVSAQHDATGHITQARVLFATSSVPSVGHAVFGLHYEGAPAPAAGTDLPAVALTKAGHPVSDVSQADTVILSNAALSVTLSRSAGWCATSLRTAAGRELLAGPSIDVVGYFDAGGAYRIGSEVGRDFAERTSVCTGQTPHQISVVEEGPARVAVSIATPDPAQVERVVRLGSGLDRVDLEITATPPFASSLVARFRTPFAGDDLTTSVPFGEVTRPRHKLFDPTFWPVTEWLDLGSNPGDGGLWASSEGSRGVSVDPTGRVEIMLTRNTYWDALGPPNREDQPHTARISLGAREGASWADGGVAERGADAQSPLRAVVTGIHTGTLPPTQSWVRVSNPLVEVSALKAAQDRSRDRVLRLVRHGRDPVHVQITTAFSGYRVRNANGLEDAMGSIAEDAADFSLDLPRSITTLRLIAP